VSEADRPNRPARTIARWTACAGAIVILVAGLAARERLEEAWHLRQLDSADLAGRLRAATRLGELRSARAIPGLIDLLRTTNAGDSLARIFGEIGPAAVAPLSRALEESRGERKRWRRHACEALGLTMSEAAIPSLITALDDLDGCVRVTAFAALGSMGARAREAVPAITSHLESRVSFIRAAANEALRSIHAAAATEAGTARLALPELRYARNPSGVK
jgi:HEAT repeat protein